MSDKPNANAGKKAMPKTQKRKRRPRGGQLPGQTEKKKNSFDSDFSPYNYTIGTGKHQKINDFLSEKLLPKKGEAETPEFRLLAFIHSFAHHYYRDGKTSIAENAMSYNDAYRCNYHNVDPPQDAPKKVLRIIHLLVETISFDPSGSKWFYRKNPDYAEYISESRLNQIFDEVVMYIAKKKLKKLSGEKYELIR